MRYEDASSSFNAAEGTTDARNDEDALAAGSRGPASGNTITGAGTITGLAGADIVANGPGQIVALEGANGSDTADGGSLKVAGRYGDLTMDSRGSYRYEKNDETPDGARDVFRYTLADAAGARDTATLTINIGREPLKVDANAQQIIPGPDGVVTLPPGVQLSDVHVVGRNLVIDMPDGSQMVIIDGAVFVPQLVLGGVEVPASNLAALLIDSEPQPAAGTPLSSGGNFAVDVPPLDPGVPLGDLIPPTELDYVPPVFEDVGQFIDEEPEIFIQPDGQPASVAAVDIVNEAGLPIRNGGEPAGSGESADGNGADNDDTSETTIGTILIDSPDDPSVVTINGTAVTSVGQVFVGTYGTLTITSISDSAIGYSYTLTDNNLLGDATHDDFSVTVTDNDGDQATATLTINIVDDVPTARNDTDAVAVRELSTDGNVITSVGTTNSPAGADTVGADNATLTSVASVNVPANSDSSFDGSGNLVVQGQFGTLTIKADGSYSYTLLGNQGAGGSEVFSYTITDGDGDTSTATLTITVPADPVPQPNNATAIVDDDGLPAGNKDSAPGDDVVPNNDGDNNEATFSGTLTANFGTDTPGTFTLAAMHNQTAVVGQETVRYTWNDASDTLTATVEGGARNGLVLFTVELNPNGAFDVTLVNNVLQVDDGTNTENNATAVLTFTATDADGDSTNATLTITLDDDIPTAVIPPIDPENPNDPPPPLVSGSVDEDDIPVDGNNDVASGDDLPINSSPTVSGAAGSLGALFNDGADQPLTYALSPDTSGLPALTSNGHDVLYSVEGGVLTAVADLNDSGNIDAGDTTVFRLTVNPDGSWEFTLVDQLDHPIAGTEDNLNLDFSSIITAEDADGDEVPAADGSFVINVDDDMPTAVIPPIDPENPNDPPPPLVSGSVDEDDLVPDGNNDVADGDDLPINSSPTVSGAAGSLSALFNGGADQPLTYALSPDTSGLPALTSNGHDVLYDVDVATGVLTAVADLNDDGNIDAGETSVFTLTVNPDGSWSFTLLDQLDHPIAGTEDNLNLDFSSIITAEDADGDPATAADGSFVINVDDDMPQAFVECPDDVIAVNDVGSTFTGNLNLPPVGADQPGTVSFVVEDGDPVLDNEGNPVTSDGDPLFYFVNGDVLEAHVGDEAGELIFTITINGDGTFTYEQFGTMGSGGETSFNNLTSASAGNAEFRGVGADDPATTIDLLLSAEAGGANTTVNTDSDSIGSANQSMDNGETVRIDFVSDLTTGAATPSGFGYSGHVSTTSFIQLIPQVQGSQDQTTALTVWALNSTNTQATEPDRDPTGGFSDSSITAVEEVTVKDYLTGNSTTVDVTGFTVGVFTAVAYGISVRVNADGSVTFSGIQQGDSYGISTGAGEFNAVAVQAEPAGTGGSTQDSFDLGIFSIGTGDVIEPVDITVPVALTDADGDSVVCDIDLILGPPVDAPDITVTVNEAGLPVIGSDPGSDSEIREGDLQPLVTGGTGPYTFTLVGSGDGAFGTLVLNEDGTFTYTLDTPFDTQPDADDGANPQLGAETFTFQAEDANGIVQTGTVTVNIIDDVPIARDDTDSVVEGASTIGNVLTGTGTTSGVAGADTAGADGFPAGTVVGVVTGGNDSVDTTNANVGVPIAGTWGTLTLNANGSYTYAATAGLNPPPGTTDVFTYTVIDNDGDRDSATLTISVVDDLTPTVDVPTTQEAGTLVDEQGLPIRGGEPAGTGEAADGNGTDNDDASEITSGTINFTSGDAPATVVIDGVTVAAGVDIAGDHGTLHIDTYNPATGVITYTYTLTDNVDHDSDPTPFETFTVTVTDVDGDIASDDLVINIVDDAPIARDDTDSVVEGASTIGNVITGTGTTSGAAGADTPGADNFAPSAVVGVVTGGNDAVDTTNANVGVPIAGTWGTLTLNADGSYTYQATAGLNPPPGTTDVFTYTVIDNDGDRDSATLTISVIDDLTPTVDVPTTGEAGTVVDEKGLPIRGGEPAGTGEAADGNGNDNDDASEFTSGTINFTSGDVPATVTIDGAGLGGPVVITGPGQTIVGEYGTMTINSYNAGTGVITYTYQLTDNVDHDSDLTPTDTFVVTVTDVDGDVASDNLVINIVDDAPIARDDTDSVVEGAATGGNVLTGVGTTSGAAGADTPGADNFPAATVVGVVTGGNDAVDTTNANVGVPIAGTWGSLTLNADGSYTYTATAGLNPPPGTTDVFTYTVIDNDGDRDSATLTISVIDDLQPVAGSATATVDDEGLANGIPGILANGDLDANVGESTPSASEAIFNGTLQGTDGDGTTTFLFQESLESTHPTVGTERIDYVVSSDGLTLTATVAALDGGGDPQARAGQPLFTVVITNADTGAYTLTLQNNVLHATGALENDATLAIPYQMMDADGDLSAAAGSLTVTFDDDMPQAIQPDPITAGLNNEPGATATADLDDDGEVITDFGADGPGLVTFANIDDGDDSGLTSNDDVITYWLSDNGQTLEGRTNSTDGTDGELIFTVAIDQAAGEYTVTMTGTIDNGSGVTFNNLTSSKAGNVDVRGVGADDPATAVDLLLTASGPGGVNQTINTDSDSVGSGNQSMDQGETVRIDFVTNLEDDPADDLATFPSGFSYDGHVGTNSYTQFIPQVQGAQTETVAFRVYALNTTVTDAGSPDDDPSGPGDGFSDSTIIPVTHVTIDGFDDGPDDGTPNQPAVTVAIGAVGVWTPIAYGVSAQLQADGSVIFTGVQQGDQYGIATGSDFNAVAVTSLAAGIGPVGGQSTTNSFDLGVFSIGSVDTGDPIQLTYDLNITDADGDTVTMVGALDITIDPAGTPAPLALSTASFSQESVADTSSFSLMIEDSPEQQRTMSAANNNSVLLGAIAAAGLGSGSVAAARDFGPGGDQMDFGAMAASAGGLRAQGSQIENSDGVGNALASEMLAIADDQSSGGSSSNRSADSADHSLTDGDSASANGPAALDKGTEAEQSASAETSLTSASVGMPSAEMLAAANANEQAALEGQAKSNGEVGRVLADALAGGHGPSIDAVIEAVANHGGPGGSANAALEAIASHGGAAVPAWHMANIAGFPGGHSMPTMETMVIHPDAAPHAA